MLTPLQACVTKKNYVPMPHSTLPSPSPLRPDLPGDWLAGAERGVLL
jgi:hypothetical protein